MKRKLIITIIIIAIIAIISFGLYYVNDYYHAGDVAQKYVNGTDEVSVMKISNGLFLDGPGNDSALIFYPGAKVEYTSYLPLLSQMAEEGVDCFLIEMPFNLALLGEDSANAIINEYNYSHYFLSGHSLGGVVASNYVHDSNSTDGLILFESYSTKEIDEPVLSIYGSEDKVLNMEQYNKSKHFISKNLTEVVIDGGNHAQVGDYGIQSGDGKAKITPQKQQKLSVEATLDFIDEIV